MTSEDSQHAVDVKIPHERVAVLIGKDGESKKELEQLTKTHINVDSQEGEVVIEANDPIALLTASDIVRAVGRGFNPDVAKLLTKIDYTFESIALADFCKTKADFIRLKGRVIGQEGKSRNILEDMTGTYVCVYGKTVGIIGALERVAIARRAIVMLLEGAQHATVYKWLERQRRQLHMMKGIDPSMIKDEVE